MTGPSAAIQRASSRSEGPHTISTALFNSVAMRRASSAKYSRGQFLARPNAPPVFNADVGCGGCRSGNLFPLTIGLHPAAVPEIVKMLLVLWQHREFGLSPMNRTTKTLGQSQVFIQHRVRSRFRFWRLTRSVSNQPRKSRANPTRRFAPDIQARKPVLSELGSNKTVSNRSARSASNETRCLVATDPAARIDRTACDRPSWFPPERRPHRDA